MSRISIGLGFWGLERGDVYDTLPSVSLTPFPHSLLSLNLVPGKMFLEKEVKVRWLTNVDHIAHEVLMAASTICPRKGFSLLLGQPT